MDSAGTLALTTALATDTTSLLQSSLAPSPASGNKLKVVQAMNPDPEFPCKFCSRTFTTAHGRGSHQKVHRNQLGLVRKNQKEPRRLLPAGPQPQLGVPLASSNVPGLGIAQIPLFNSYQSSSAEETGGGGHVGIFSQVNQEEFARYYSWSWLRSSAMPSFLSQTGSTSAQPFSFAAPAPVAEGDGRTGDDMPTVNQEEIDQTLRL